MIEVRTAVSSDIDWLTGLERDNFSLPWTRELFSHMLSDERTDILVAEEGGYRLGYLAFSRVLDEGSVDNVCTAPEHRRHGVGDALLTAAEDLAAGYELTSITLEVRESNAPALALYEKHGFANLGKRPGYYEQPREDAVIMTLYLG